MFPYWLLYSMFAVGALSGARSTQLKSNSPLLVASAVLVTLFIGLRYQTGGDWGNYMIILQATPQDLETALTFGEVSYMFLNWVARRMGLGLWFVNLICASIFVWGLSRLARREPNPWLTIAVAIPYLVIVVGMGYTRQAVAIGFIMAAIVSFNEKRLIQVAILAVLALSFHKTALLVFPLMGLAVVRHRFVVWGALALLGTVFFTTYFSSIMDRFASSYLEAEMASEGAFVRVIMNVLPALIFLIIPNRLSRSVEERKLLRNFALAALAALAGLFLLDSTTVVDRLALYLIPLQLIVLGRLPYAFAKSGRSSSELVLAILAYSATVQFVWFNFAIHADRWLPYRFLLAE